MKSIDNALIKATEDYIRQLIGQMRSNPSPELLLALRAMLGISGIDKNLIEEAYSAPSSSSALVALRLG